MNYASIGSISTGTLLTSDLLDTFASELEHLVQRNAQEWCSDDGRKTRDRLLKLVGDARECEDMESDESSELLAELQDALGEFAKPYCYFGTLEGDGADFGFWPSMDQISELPKINDPSEADSLGEDCAYVNDHGNVTVYGGDGKVILDIV